MSLLRADARALPLRDGCVQCCVTSPPYFGLRDYGVTGQIGLEPTPGAYVTALVAVCHEVRRVLRDDGVLWLNLGDTYAGSRAGAGDTSSMNKLNTRSRGVTVSCGVEAEGPDGGAVARRYYDKDALCEPYQDATLRRGRSIRQVAADGTKTYRFNGEPLDSASIERGRNARSVWTLPTQPFRGAHFAVMPEALAERCIKAGSRPGDLVFDPFGGSGTVALVARQLNRRAVLTELSAEYLALARQRVTETPVSLLEADVMARGGPFLGAPRDTETQA